MAEGFEACRRCGVSLVEIHRWVDRELKPQTSTTCSRQPYCERCKERIQTAEAWNEAAKQGGEILVAALTRIGVGRLFCRDGRGPSMNDPGLREVLSGRSMKIGRESWQGRGIFAMGPVGTHKTHLLAARTFDHALRGFTAKLLNWQTLCLEVRATYMQTSTVSELDIIERYSQIEYLGIDDLGSGKTVEGRETEAARVVCYTIINNRNERALTTDISSNLFPEELNQRFDDRIGRRISEMCETWAMVN